LNRPCSKRRWIIDVIEGKMNGKRPRGRPRIGMLDELKEGSYQQMKEERITVRNGDVMCIEPVYKQNTYDDDDDL